MVPLCCFRRLRRRHPAQAELWTPGTPTTHHTIYIYIYNNTVAPGRWWSRSRRCRRRTRTIWSTDGETNSRDNHFPAVLGPGPLPPASRVGGADGAATSSRVSQRVPDSGGWLLLWWLWKGSDTGHLTGGGAVAGVVGAVRARGALPGFG